jgi:hypothetical protein
LIEEVIRRFTRNRIGPKPVVFVKIPPKLLYLPSRNESLEKLIRVYLYESLLMGNPDTPVRIMIHRPAPLKDLESFVGICPIYWTQLRIQMHGLCILNNLVKEKFSEIGYDCEEWVGVENATAQLAIFGSSWPGTKVIFCADVAKDVTKYDLLIPVSSPSVDS